jgi:site-specific recombinase XerD
LLEYRETLKEHQQTGHVWWGRQGPLTYSGMYQIFARTAKQTSLHSKKFNPHAWRHAFGRDATKNGMPTAILQKVLGHESVETTQIYIGPDEETIRQAHHKYSPIDDLQIDSGNGS